MAKVVRFLITIMSKKKAILVPKKHATLTLDGVGRRAGASSQRENISSTYPAAGKQ